MLARWMELLPLFVVRWLALRYCERLRLAGAVGVVMARPDVLVRLKTPHVRAKPGATVLSGTGGNTALTKAARNRKPGNRFARNTHELRHD